MREIYEVDLAGPTMFEVSALLISNITWPGVGDAAGRDSLYSSLCAWSIRDRGRRDPEWAQQPQLIRPDHACRAEADINRDWRTLDRRLRDRLTAGHLTIPFLVEAETGVTPKLPGGVARLSINQLAPRVEDDLGLSDPENIPRRVWRPSKPVIHLCSAWATLAQEHFNSHGAQLQLDDIMRSQTFLAQLIDRARIYEGLLERGRLKIAPGQLIRFRVVGTGVKNVGFS